MAKLKSVRIVPTKNNTYKLHYYNPDGRRRRLSVGPDYQLAQRQAVKFTEWLLAGKEPEHEIEKAQQLEKAKKITVREFYPLFMERHGSMQSKNMQESYKYSFKNICRCPVIADSGIELITKSLVIDYRRHRTTIEGVTNATVNREVDFLKVMLSCAVEWEILNHSPLNGLKKLPEAEKREVNLSPEQAKSLINALPSPLDSIVEFAIYSGFRKNNILGLKVESIRFFDIKPDSDYMAEGEIELIVKSGRREKFPIGPDAARILRKEIGNREYGYVFLNPLTGTRYRNINKTFDRFVRKFGFTVNGTKLRFHDLRHVFGTWLRMAGVSLDDIRSLMGHQSLSTTDKYVTPDRLRIGKLLNLLPSIRGENEHKKMASIS